MNPNWERAQGPPIMAGEMLMDAELIPHRSLSAKAFKAMLAAMIVLNGAVAAMFVARGAFPVAGFLGLDVLALWLAFRWNYRAGRCAERVRIAPGQVHVARLDAKGAQDHWVLNPIWAQVGADAASVWIASRGARVRLGAFLSPRERASFRRALEAALWRAKRPA